MYVFLYAVNLGFLITAPFIKPNGNPDAFLAREKYGFVYQIQTSVSGRQTRRILTICFGRWFKTFDTHKAGSSGEIIQDPEETAIRTEFEHAGKTIHLVSGKNIRKDFAGELLETSGVWIFDKEKSAPDHDLIRMDFLPMADKTGKNHVPEELYKWMVEEFAMLGGELASLNNEGLAS